MPKISAYTDLNPVDNADVIVVNDVSATITKKATKANFLADIKDGTGINNQAIKPKHMDFGVVDATARLALASPFEGMTCYQEDVDATYIYDGTAWRCQAQWEELGRTTLGSNGDTISITPIAVRKYLRVYFQLWGTGGTLTPAFRFNNDTGANYAASYSANFAAPAVSVSQTSLGVTAAVSPAFQQGIWDIANIATRRKIVRGTSSDDNDASATTSSNNVNLAGKWDNSANAITRIDLVNVSGTGDFVAGAQMVVLGRD